MESLTAFHCGLMLQDTHSETFEALFEFYSNSPEISLIPEPFFTLLVAEQADRCTTKDTLISDQVVQKE
jgi:hypothetical protein